MNNPSSPAITLPNELWDRVFSSLDSRKDVAACRMVCRSFKELSSPYLMNRICFALRMATLNKLYDVMEHPYFRRYITELVYDTSEYDARLEDPGAYEAAREDSELQFQSATLRNQSRLRLFTRALQHPIADEDARIAMLTTIASDRRPLINTPRDSDVEVPEEDKMPWHRSWVGLVEYHERLNEQLALEDKNGVATIYQQALKAFPRLNRVIFGDYRNLVGREEDYATCCSRVFRKEMLPPRIPSDPPIVNFEPSDEEDKLSRWTKLFFLLDILSTNSVEMKTLTIGSNSWSVTAGENEQENLPSTKLAPMHLLCADCTWPEEVRGLEKLCELSMPVHTGIDLYGPEEGEEDLSKMTKDMDESPMSMMLNAAAQSLTYLDLGAVDLMFPEGVEPDDFGLALSIGGVNVLRLLLFSIRFPALNHLKLTGWVIQPEEFLEFLEKMKDTLEFLDLRFNIIEGPSMDRQTSKSLAKRGGERLSLKGVIIGNYELETERHPRIEMQKGCEISDYLEMGYGYVARGRDEECEGLWLGGRVNLLGGSRSEADSLPSHLERSL